MSIIETYDNKTEAIITPQMLTKKKEGFPKIAIITFFNQFQEILIKEYNAVKIASVSCSDVRVPVYKVNFGGKEIAFCVSPPGGAVSGTFMEQLIAKGANKFFAFGSCGVLEKNIATGHIIVPTEAYRDEGMSYHYAPPADYIKLPLANALAEVLEELNVPYIKTKTWTTDAIFRETRGNMQKRKAEGCLTVEMECASLVAIAAFRNVEFAQYIFAEDSLDGVEWDARIMGGLTEKHRQSYVVLALEIVARLF